MQKASPTSWSTSRPCTISQIQLSQFGWASRSPSMQLVIWVGVKVEICATQPRTWTKMTNWYYEWRNRHNLFYWLSVILYCRKCFLLPKVAPHVTHCTQSGCFPLVVVKPIKLNIYKCIAYMTILYFIIIILTLQLIKFK